MAVRPYWKGFLKLSLVTCPITLTPATTEGEKVKFHTLNRKTGDRIYTRYVDAETGNTVDKDDQVKGYERAENEYLVLEDEELESVHLESVKTIDIGEFAPLDTVEWTYFDTPYFVVPDAEISEEAFIIIRQAMANKGVVGLSRLTISGRERPVLLQPWEDGIILWTLRYGNEVRDEDEYWEEIDDQPVDKKMMSMVEKLIADRTVDWSDKMARDPVQDNIKEIIKAKDKPKPKRKKAAKDEEDEAPAASNVIDLMAALKKSLESNPDATPKKKRGS
ncbi:non-homologous end joining protein Ku [Devosia aurantiaca]|uniref:Non-homologous end joining protein Ku n=1 Tax=Devosia aurantiaca TaxID=2714858 RepID=A0A6M1SK82_9HYPH|nr:Ku protein [Devosia aurantiaca]NGP17628.1 Ku protein [Devosia aurantiaca]